MKRFFTKDTIYFILLLLFSLIPLLWYKPGTIGLGHDMGWSLVPIDRFFERFWTWSPTAFGGDYSLYLGSITFYGIEAFFAALRLPMIWVQKCTFIFWFFAMSSSMYILCRTLYKGKYAYLFAFLAACFYAMNHFTLHDWIIAEFSKWSAMTAFSLLLAIFWQTIEKRFSLIKGAFWVGIVSLFFNGGGGSGIPVLGGLLLGLTFLLIYKGFIEKKNIFWLLRVYITLGLIGILVNAYWIVPLFYVVKTQYSPFASSGGADVTVAWTNVISLNASLLNLFRLQGFSSWYDTLNHPYANYFLTNPLLIAASLIFPILSFGAYLFAKSKEDKNIVIFFSLLTLVGLVFTAGTHPPFGVFYSFLMTKVYGFAIFRTAFYKFGYVLWGGYAFLFSYSIIHILILLKKKVFVILFLTFVTIFLCMYNFPFFTGSFFDFDPPFKTMIQLPPYIPQAVDYVSTLPQTSRILLVPPPSPTNGQSDVYQFGYFSRTPLPFQITQKSVVTNVEVNSEAQEQLTESLYKAMQNGDENQTRTLLAILGVTHILVRNDVLTNNEKYRIVSPSAFNHALSSFSWIKKEKIFGKWTFYSIRDSSPLISTLNPTFYFVGGNQLPSQSLRSDVIALPESYKTLLPGGVSQEIYGICQTCIVQSATMQPKVTFLPTSPFYFFVEWEEKKRLRASQPYPISYLGYQLFYMERHALELNLLSQQEEGREDNLFDEQQRFHWISDYTTLVKESKKTFDNLSKQEQITQAKVIQESLKTQLQHIDTINNNKIVSDIGDQYYELHSSLTDLLHAPRLVQALAYNANNYLYTVEIPQEGEYKILTSSDYGIDTIQVDGNLLSKDYVELSQGTHRIDISSPKSVLLTQNPLALNDESQDIKIPINALQKNRPYLLSFDYKKSDSLSMGFSVKDDLGAIKVADVIVPDTQGDTKHYTTTFRTGNAINNSYTFQVYLEQKNIYSNAHISNLSIQEVASPQISFQLQDTPAALRESTPAHITTTIVNPTTYKITIKNATSPFALLFRDSYSSLWKARMSDGTVLSPSMPFYNSFNGWYINKKGTFTITITFSVQNAFYIGALMSIFTILLITGIHLYKRKRI